MTFDIRKKTSWLHLALTVGLTALLAACYPSPDLEIQEYDTVVTIRTEGVDFNTFDTYAIPDTVFERPDDGTISKETKDFIFAEVNRNMQAIGYQLEADPENNPPDVVVIIGVVTQDQYSAFNSWPFFGGYNSYSGWGIGYPGSSVRYVYTLGSITLDMLDWKNVDIENEIVPVLWSAAVNGRLQEDAANQTQRISDGIDQAFAQSPYLNQQ